MKRVLFILILQGISLAISAKEQNFEAVFTATNDLPKPKDIFKTNLNSDECCGGISGIELKLSGDPAGYQFGLIGKYNLQSDLETGRHYWVKENGNYAIWYTEHNVQAWMVGSIGNLGSSTGGLGSRCTKECGYCCEEWQYSDLIGQWHVSDEILLEVDPICSEMCIL